MANEPKVYTVEQIAKMLSVNRETVWRWTRENIWPRADIRHGKKLSRWTQQAIEKGIAQLRRATTAADKATAQAAKAKSKVKALPKAKTAHRRAKRRG